MVETAKPLWRKTTETIHGSWFHAELPKRQLKIAFSIGEENCWLRIRKGTKPWRFELDAEGNVQKLHDTRGTAELSKGELDKLAKHCKHILRKTRRNLEVLRRQEHPEAKNTERILKHLAKALGKRG